MSQEPVGAVVGKRKRNSSDEDNAPEPVQPWFAWEEQKGASAAVESVARDLVAQDLIDFELENRLHSFLNRQGLRRGNEWLYGDYLDVYVRVSMRLKYDSGGKPVPLQSNGGQGPPKATFVPTLDLANFNISNPQNRKKGLARSFITMAIREAAARGFEQVFVENISVNEWCWKLVRDHGFARLPFTFPSCLVLNVKWPITK